MISIAEFLHWSGISHFVILLLFARNTLGNSVWIVLKSSNCFVHAHRKMLGRHLLNVLVIENGAQYTTFTSMIWCVCYWYYYLKMTGLLVALIPWDIVNNLKWLKWKLAEVSVFLHRKKKKIHLPALGFLCKSSEWYSIDVRSVVLTWFTHWIQIWKAKMKLCSQRSTQYPHCLQDITYAAYSNSHTGTPSFPEGLWNQTRASSTLWALRCRLLCRTG